MTTSLATNPSVRSAIGLLEAWLESQLAYRGWPGLSIGIVHDQELIWARGFGHASLERSERARPDTLYRIASITKLFTSTAILQLRDAGKLRLSDPLTQHLPWFKIGEAYPDAPPITIEHLLTHTAGLPRELGFPYWTTSDFPSAEDARRRLPLASGLEIRRDDHRSHHDQSSHRKPRRALRLGYHPAYGSEQGHQGKGAQTRPGRRVALALEADQQADAQAGEKARQAV
jgi:CubicO group peptidase (beta-lactamase class C family)